MATTEELLNLAQTQAQQLKSSFESFKANKTVPVNVLEQPPQALDLSSAPLVKENGMADTLRGEFDSMLSASQAEAAKTEEGKLSGRQAELINLLAGKDATRLGIEKDVVDPIQQQLNKFESLAGVGMAELDKFDDMTAFEEEAFLGKLGARDVTKGMAGAKLTRFQRERQLERISRAAEVRTTLAKAEYLRGNVELANKQVERALDMQYAPVEAELAQVQDMLETARKRSDTQDQRFYEERLMQVQQERADVADAKALALTAASTGTASPGELDILTDPSATPDEKLNLALNIINRGASIERAAKNRASANREGEITSAVGNLMSSPDLGSDTDPMIAVLEATSGGRSLTQSETEPLTNARRVVGQLDDIIAGITDAYTGPILGIIRSNNPYDVKARELEASLIALVPQLARGIYGEVGVLTDSDVERYVRTLPNMSSTVDVNKAVAALTLRNVRSAFVGQLEAMAAAGRDVSGFVGIYQQMNSQIETLESELGIGAEYSASVDNEYEQFQQGSQQENRGVWDSVASFLFGVTPSIQNQ